MVGFKGYVAVAVRSLDRLKASVVCYVPDCYTIYVLGGSRSIRNSYGYFVTVKASDGISAYGHGEVIDGLVAYLSLLLVGKRILYRIRLGLIKLSSRKAYVVLAFKNTAVSGKSRNVKGCVLKLDTRARKSIGIKVFRLIALGSYDNRLGCSATIYDTGVGLYAARKNAVVPLMVVGVDFDFLGIAVTALTGVSL